MTPPSELHARIAAKKVLLGCSVETFAPSSTEMAGIIGFDVIWADFEHMGGNPQQVEVFCIAAKAGGAFPLIRIPFAERFHIMTALEGGARIVAVPMVESADMARLIVEYGKFRPVGNRGFANSTRGLNYGLGQALDNVTFADRESHLLPQIETSEALRRCKEIVGVDGISGALIGPADLSFSMGKPLQFDNPEVVKAVGQAIREVRSLDKIAAIATGHPGLMREALDAGVQLIVCAGERPALRVQWEKTVKDMSAMINGR